MYVIHGVSAGDKAMVVKGPEGFNTIQTIQIYPEIGHHHVLNANLGESVLFPKLKEGEYRVVLRWDAELDLDIHAHLSPANKDSHMSWLQPSVNTRGMQGALGFDEVEAGLEYIHLRNVPQNCEGLPECRIAFRVHVPAKDHPRISHMFMDYFKSAVVTVTDWQGKETVYEGGVGTAGKVWWTVFSLNGLIGELFKCPDINCGAAPG